MTTVLYCRVSTVDQTVEHQRTQALQVGFTPDLVLADHGVSGVSTRLCERRDGCGKRDKSINPFDGSMQAFAPAPPANGLLVVRYSVEANRGLAGAIGFPISHQLMALL